MRGRRGSRGGLSAAGLRGENAVDPACAMPGIVRAQEGRQERFGPVLVADRPEEPLDCQRAQRAAAAVRARREGPAMHHRGGDLRAGRPALRASTGSIIARIHAPERTRSANRRSRPTVRARSPSSCLRGSPVSHIGGSMRGPRFMMPSATASRQRARVTGTVSETCGKAACANPQAAATSAGPAVDKAGSRAAPMAGSTARKASAVATSAAPMRTLPQIVTGPGGSILIQLS